MHNRSLILDIGNGSIGAAVVGYESTPRDKKSDKDAKTPSGSITSLPTVLYSHREPLAFLAEVSEDRLLAVMLELLKSVLVHLQKEAGAALAKTILGRPTLDHVVCIFSSPWYMSQTTVVKNEQEKAFTVTNAMVSEMIAKEEVRFSQSLSSGDYEKYFGAAIVLLERALVHTTINGYEVANPVGKKARTLEITLFTSLISETVLRTVEEVFYHAFHVRKIECFSYALASWNAIRTLFPDAQDFIFLDVSGETSDITITVRGAITETISFPFGRATILRSLVKMLAISPETAVSYMKMRASGTLEKAASDSMEKALQAVSDQWVEIFNKTLSTISKKYNLPKKAFVTVDSDLNSFFSGVLNRADIGPALFKGPFEVTIVAGSTIAPFIQTRAILPAGAVANSSADFLNTRHEMTLPGGLDPALALEAIFFRNKLV